MDDTNNQNLNNGNSDDQPEKIDLKKFKDDLLVENKMLMGKLAEDVVSMVQQNISGKQNVDNGRSVEPVIDSDDISGIEEDLINSGIDPSQVKAIVKTINKVTETKSKKISEDVESRIDGKLNFKDSRTSYTQQAMSEYPDIRKPDTELFKLTKAKYKNLSPAVKETPEGEYIAVTLAAKDLGILPSKVESALSVAAVSRGGDVIDIESGKKKQIVKDAVSIFGMDKMSKEVMERINEKMKARA